MKTSITILVLALAMTNLRAQESPNEIARIFFKAIQKKDMERAKTITHSKFHQYLAFMADAKLQEGVDTTDRRDYANAQYKAISTDAGVLKIRNGNDEEILYLAREGDGLKVDLMGTAADYKNDLYIVTIIPDFQDGEAAYTMAIRYTVADIEVNKKIESTLKANMPFLRNIRANSIQGVRIVFTDTGKEANVTIKKQKDKATGELEVISESRPTKGGIYEYTSK